MVNAICKLPHGWVFSRFNGIYDGLCIPNLRGEAAQPIQAKIGDEHMNITAQIKKLTIKKVTASTWSKIVPLYCMKVRHFV